MSGPMIVLFKSVVVCGWCDWVASNNFTYVEECSHSISSYHTVLPCYLYVGLFNVRSQSVTYSQVYYFIPV